MEKTAGLKPRNYGIDLLRIVSMLMIVMWHVIVHGNVDGSTEIFSVNHIIVDLLQAFLCCAVNCYALISGYVGVNAKHKYTNIIMIYLQVWFFSVLIEFIYLLTTHDFEIVRTVKAFLPLCYGGYWYFTAYFLLFFLMPVLNIAVQKLERKQLKSVIIAGILLMSVLTTILRIDIFHVIGGYSTIWLALLYLVGGYIKKYNSEEKYTSSKLVVFLIISVLVNFVVQIGVEYVNKAYGTKIAFDYTITEYCSPLAVVTAVLLLLIFVKMNITKGIKLISFFASATFGVYIIHDNFLIKSEILSKAFNSVASCSPIIMLLSIIGFGLAVFIICSLADKIRQRLFKVLKLKDMFLRIENKQK